MTRLREFWKDRKGATAILMSIAIVPIIGTLAIGTDYSKVVNKRYSLQQVVDSTATAIARDPDSILISNTELQARALSYAKAVSGSVPVDNFQITATINADRVQVDGGGNVKLAFAKVLGAESLAVKASVTVELGKMKNIELALVLDNTGSMQGNKITQLRAAVKKLVDFFEPRIQNTGDVKIAMVPFTNVVKTNPSWMQSWMLQSTPPQNWSGCVNDRSSPYDVTDDPPVAGVGNSLYWWKSNCGGLAEIIPMTSDLQVIRSAADTMIASGSTDVPLGMAWGWHALSSGVPLTQGSPPGTENKMRVMLVLTDGDNTAHRWASNIDSRMTTICNNVKAANITVFTVRVIDGNANLLKNCATSPVHYFNVTNATQLTPVFEQIASTMSKMRISK